jgi:HEAT repeat protein
VAFRELGTNAIPALLRIIESKDTPFQRLILALNRMQSLVHFPARQPWSLKWAASCDLYAMGANAKPAFPALTNLLLRTNAAIYSAISLAGIGPEGLPPLLAALTNQNEKIRESAAFGLSWERSDLNIVVPALIARLSDQSIMVHRTAVSALGELHAEPRLAVPALMKDFPGSDPLLRRLILTSIGRFETNAGAAVPMLLESFSDNDQNVPRSAASALKRIDPAAAAKAGVK